MAEQPQTASSSSQPSHKSPESSLDQPQVPVQSGFSNLPNGDFQIFPIMYPFLANPHQNPENMNRGSGLYAVPIYPYSGPVVGIPSNTLIPLTYNIPIRTSTESGTTNEGRGQESQHHQNQQQQQRGPNQQPGPQRQVVVRRFQIAIRLDLFLILKLVAVIFLFNQDGSRLRLVVLMIFALLIYLYQTGSLTPLIRWFSQGMHRVPRDVVRPENVPPLVRRGIVEPPLEEIPGGAENENRAADNNNNDEAVENENLVEPNGPNAVNQWWAIVKEIQMIVFAFITSLLPGFHNID